MRSLTEIGTTEAARGSAQGATGVDPRQVSDWNETLPDVSNASVFHSVQWAEVLLKTYGWTPFYVKTGSAILPLIEARSWATAPRGVSLPFSDFCGALSATHQADAGLIETALELGRARRWKYLEIRGGSKLFGDEIAVWQRFFGHDLDLRGGPGSVFAGFEPSVKRAVRKAESLGVETALESDRAGLDAFWNLHLLTRRRHGIPPQPFGFMMNIMEELIAKDMGLIAVARYKGRAIAACLFLHFGKRALYKFGASDFSCQHFRAMNAAMWAGIRYYAAQGFESMHMGRTELENPGLRRFKLGWGTRETLLNYWRYDFAQRAFRPGCENRRLGLAKYLFKALPTPVLRAIGSASYRHAA